jgi:hypothetical protein
MDMHFDPRRLWGIQAARRSQWISIQGTFMLAVLAAPVVLAITRQEPAQILKLGYPFLSFFLAMPANHFASASSYLTAGVSLAVFLLIVSIIQPIVHWISGLTPGPDWYVAVIPLYIFLDVMNGTVIPTIERIEWKNIIAISRQSEQDLMTAFKDSDTSNPQARKVYANVFVAKEETIWEKLRYMQNKKQQLNSQPELKSKRHPESKGINVASIQQTETRRVSATSQQSTNLDELHELHRQAYEALQKVQHTFEQSSSESQGGFPPKLTSISADYMNAFFRNDQSTLRMMIHAELNITLKSEDDLMKSTTLPTQLEVARSTGSYLLIRRGGRHWLVPTFQVLKNFTTNQPAKGIFAYVKDSVPAVELRQPAEVNERGCVWEVVNMGIIAVPI